MHFALAILVTGIAFDLTSIIGWGNPPLGTVLGIAIVCAVAVLAAQTMRFGVMAVVLELLWGSHGHAVPIELFGYSISLRMGIFLAVCGAMLWHLRKTPIRALLWETYRTHPLRYPAGALLLSLLLAGILGMIRHPWNEVYRDANAWAFLLLMPAIVLGTINARDRSMVLQTLLMGAGYLLLRTYALIFVFTHDLGGAWLPLYRWIRDTRLGEITFFSGGFPRIFFPSMVLLFPVLLLAGYRAMRVASIRYAMAPAMLAGASIAVLIVSLSRSFWLALLGLGVTGCGYYAFQWLRTHAAPRCSARIALIGGMACGGIAFAAMLIWLPYPQRITSSGLSATLTARLLTSQEPAIANRWQEIVPLRAAIAQHAILGNGFGATVTYDSKDPRTLAAFPDGKYTTSVVEWGYLDDALERGIIGVLIELWFLVMMIEATRRARADTAAFGYGIAGIAIVHMVSPYFNHPLGIGALLLATAMVASTKKTPTAGAAVGGLSGS